MNQEEKQKFISNDFPQYHLNILESLNQEQSLEEKVVIDIGGSNIPAEIMRLFGVKKFICLDPVSKWNSFFNSTVLSEHNGKKVCKLKEFSNAFEEEFSFIVDEDIENIKQEMAGLFDVVFSISTFEHVTSLKKTLDVIYKILKPQGFLLSQYEPIFSCAAGHHVWISEDYNFNNMPEIEHMHLLYDRDEAQLFLNTIGRFNEEIRKKIIEQAYDSKIINRFMLNDHLNAFRDAKFNKYEIEYFFIHPAPEDRLKILCEKYGQMRYDVRGIKYIAYKENV